MEIIDGRFEVVGTLGEGADAEVFEVTDRQSPDRPLALKLLRPGALAPLRAEALRLEFKLLSRLHHPNLVEVQDFARARDSGRYYYTMEVVHGCAVDEHLAEAPVSEVLAACGAIAAALDCVHAAGFVHGDLKPSNILCTAEGRVCVLDAGMAAAVGRSGAPSGTALYMAPERIRGDPVGPGSDLYALGVLLYRLLLGRHPFEGSLEEVLRAQVGTQPVPPRTLRPDLPWGQQALILSLLAKDPGARPRSAAVVHKRLAESHDVAVRQPLETAVRRRGPLTGRDALLATLRRRLRASLGLLGRSEGPAAPCVLLVEGAPGSGKSRVLAELRAALAVEGVRPQSLAFPLAEDFDEFRRRCSLRDVAGRPPVLEEAAEQPVLILLDDLDCAPPAEAEAADELVTSILLEAAFGSGARLAVVLTGAAGTQLTARPERHVLEPLDVADVRTLASALSGRSVENETAEALHAATGGNPYLLESAVLSTPEGLDSPPAPTAPRGFWQAWDALPPDGRSVLGLLASARSARAEALATACNSTTEDVWAWLRPLEVNGFLRRDGDRFRFAQQLCARAVLDRLEPEQRRETTQRWCDRFEEGDPERVRMLLDAGLPAEEEAVLAAQQLGEAGRPGLAAVLLDRCLASTPDPTEALLSSRLRWSIDLGDAQRAASLLETLAQRYPATDAAAGVARARWAAIVAFFQQDLEEAGVRLDEAEAWLQRTPLPLERVKLAGIRATLRFHAGLADEAIEHTEVMEQLAHEAALPAEAGTALGKRAVILARLGRYPETTALLGRALEQFELAGDKTGCLETIYNLALADATLGNLESAERTYRRSLKAAIELGDRLREVSSRTGLADVLLERGAFDEALQCLDRAAAIEQVFDFDPLEGRLVRGRLELLRGDPGGALRSFRQARDAARSPADQATACAHLALLHLRLGDGKGAGRILAGATPGPVSEAWLVEAATAALDADDERLQSLARTLEQEGRRLASAEVLLLLAACCPEAAAESLQRAEAHLEGLGARVAEARSCLLAGKLDEAIERARQLDLREVHWRAVARRGGSDEEALALAEAWLASLEPEDAEHVARDADLEALRRGRAAV